MSLYFPLVIPLTLILINKHIGLLLLPPPGVRSRFIFPVISDSSAQESLGNNFRGLDRKCFRELLMHMPPPSPNLGSLCPPVLLLKQLQWPLSGAVLPPSAPPPSVPRSPSQNTDVIMSLL